MNEYFAGLTKAQVEALKECFDFLRNGYVEVFSSWHRMVAVILLRHKENGNRLSVRICRYTYAIYKNHELVKAVGFKPDNCLYNIAVDSDMSLKVESCQSSRDARLIKGSLSPNKNES